ncbi:Ste50p [Sporobolomyces koalae]|uniref:Ste50p n=1 Tax=Sporobolomyces koalae TaxID=500713 RepID=UPI003172A0D5
MQAHDQEYYLDLLSQFNLPLLDEAGVDSLFHHLGYPHLTANLIEHGITGEVLIHLDHTALKDVGVHSVGQRLNILKTVYVLKVLANIPIEEGHYVPPSEELEDGQLPSSQIIALLTERDDRIRSLESEVQHLYLAFQNLKEEALNIARSAAATAPKARSNLRSPTSSTFPHPLSNASTLSRSNSLSNPSTTSLLSSQAHHHHPRPRAVPSNPNLAVAAAGTAPSQLLHPLHAGLPDSPHSPGIDSPRMVVTDYQAQQNQSHLTVAGNHDHANDFSIDGIKTPTTPTAPLLVHPESQQAQPSLASSSAASSRPSTSSATDSTAASTVTTISAPSTRRDREPSTSADPNNPYRSFRVTLEDPCYKVLPAALKKYKINDDWRLYALFICYGNTERCLAYDEKPLLLFQRLKESNDNPVFMLRHIKDIKSPISVASAKHAARREKRQPGVGSGVERSLMGVNRDGSVVNASGLVGNARPTRLHHPPVLLPVGKERDAAGKLSEDEDSSEAKGDRQVAKDKDKPTQGYCIAIYPYLAEREDEFDVAVGDTFIILSKTKGWWVVHRDVPPPASSLSSSTSSNPDQPPQARKSAWVPAGCLLETSVPPLSLVQAWNAPASTSEGSATSNAASIPILPSYVVSVSTPGIALMDYSPRSGGTQSGELEVKKGQPLRILKRYNHWSYAIKEDGGRGWVPSWFCGRANKGDGTPTTPTTSIPPAPSTSVPSASSGADGGRPATAPSVAPPTSSLAPSKPAISIALPSPGIANGAKSAGPVMNGASGSQEGE